MESELDLGRYFAILRKWYRLILLGTLLAGGVALVVSFVLPPVYEAEASVASVKSLSQISLSPEYKTLSEGQLTQGLDVGARQKALVAIARGNGVAADVIAELGSSLSPDERQIANLVGMVNVSTDGDLIRIKVQNKDPQKTAKIADTWARLYATRVNQLYTESPANLDQIQAQANQAWQNYQTAETALGQFIGQNRIDALSREIDAKQKTINDLYTAQRSLGLLLQDAKSLQEMVAKDTSLTSNDAGSRLAALLIRANAATLSYSATPLQLQVTSASLNDPTPSNIRLQIESLIGTLEARKKQVESQLGDPALQLQVLSLQKELEQQTAKRQELTAARDLAWSTYKTMASKLEEVRIGQQSGGTIVRLAASAVVPERPIAPKKTTNTLLAAVVGFMLSVGAAFLAEFLDPSIRSPREVAEQLRLPVVEIQPERVRAETPILPSETPTSRPLPEDYYRLWANLFLGSQTPHRTLLLASAGGSTSPIFANGAGGAHGGDGQNAVVANLGIVAAQSGRSVILVDCNGPSPTLDQIFGLPNARGWSNLLEEEHPNIASYLQPTSIKNLKVITSGLASAQIEESIVSPRLPSVINALKEKTDLVIFGSPAPFPAADALLMAKYVEGALLLVTAGLTSREAAVQLKEQLQNVGANLLGVIVVEADSGPIGLRRLAARANLSRKITG